MNASASRWQKAALALALIPLLFLAGLSQDRLNRDRIAMGVTRGEPLGRTAPPVLVFTSVALGGFRGLIANALWLRAVELQEEGKYFEKVQLSDWITKLQPHFITVWYYEAWDMSYNISIKFNDPKDRWQWVKRGIELLRDEGLKYNPDATMLYRELAWIYQHKIGQDLDDAHLYFKSAWAREMEAVLGTNYVALINPQSEDEIERSRVLRERYKLDPNHMKAVDDTYGPLEWRLPESHSVYWATYGLKRAKKEEQITLRRAIYQPLQLAFHRGRIIEFKLGAEKRYSFGPNLPMIPNANRAYENMMAEDAENRAHISTGHRNFLKDAVYFLYTHNRRADAEQWFRYLLKNYPAAEVVDVRMTNAPSRKIAGMTVDDFAIARVTEDIGETDRKRVQQAIEGMLVQSFFNLAIGESEQAAGYALMAQQIYNRYQSETAPQTIRVGMPELALLRLEAFRAFESNYDPLLVLKVRSILGDAAPPPLATTTNAPPGSTTPP